MGRDVGLAGCPALPGSQWILKSIKFVQWSSSILLVITVIWTLGMGTLSMFIDGMVVGDVVKISGAVLLFVGPEKAAAFFGPVLKRKKEEK